MNSGSADIREQQHDQIAKAIADVLGHGMREKCHAHADAVLAVIHQESAAIKESSVPNAGALVDDQPAYSSVALAMVAAERKRQIDAEGYTPEHDDEHTNGDIARGAAWYALPDSFFIPDGIVKPGSPCLLYLIWPQQWEMPKPGDRVRDLTKAGAMILAEIERLHRVAARAQGGAA